MPKVIILYNPHVDDFMASPPHFWALRRRPLKKYGFFISEAILRGGSIRILIDAELSAFIPEKFYGKMPRLIRRVISFIEFKWWLKINDLDSSKIVRVSTSELTTEDVIFAFSYKSAVGKFSRRLQYLRRCRAVIFHLSHYFIATQEKSFNLRSLPNVILAGDSDISGNDYFQHYFSWYHSPFLVLPFAVAPRFSKSIPYELRESKCLATGSFHDLTQEFPAYKYVDFISFTNLETYHPLRREIFNAKEGISDQVVCGISPYREYKKKNFLYRFISHFKVSQKKYFSHDIAALYNRYQFAVVGEELAGFPALGALEAMACGALLIGNPSFYRGTGLEVGKHFLAHDGTLKGLLATLSSVEFSVAKATADKGNQFVLKQFNSGAVYKVWIDRIVGAACF